MSSKPPIVLLHGFTQTSAVWAQIEAALVDSEAIDLPGHGFCDADHDNDDLWSAADYLVNKGKKGLYVGYSLGARVALHAAIRHPDKVLGLILFGPKLGYSDRAQANVRREADNALADHIEAVGTKRFVEEWLQLPFNKRVDSTHTYRGERSNNRAEGLAASLRATGSGVQDDLRPYLANLNVPITVVIGEFDLPDVTDDAKELERMGASLLVVSNCGHAVPFEQPKIAGDVILQAWSADFQ